MIDSNVNVKQVFLKTIAPSLTKQINLKDIFLKRKLKVIRCLELLDQ